MNNMYILLVYNNFQKEPTFGPSPLSDALNLKLFQFPIIFLLSQYPAKPMVEKTFENPKNMIM